MLRRYTILSIMMILLVLLTGCWDYRPLETLSFASGIGIDRDEHGYMVTVQFANPEEIAGNNHTERPEAPIYQERGKTIEEAVTRLTLNVPYYVHFSNIQLVALGESVATKNIQEVLEYIYRFNNIRSDFKLIIAKQQNAADILQVVSPLSKVTAEKIANVVQKMEDGTTMTVGAKMNFFHLITQMNSPYEGFVINGFHLRGKKYHKSTIRNTEILNPQAQVYPTGLAVFKNNHLQGWLTISESIGYNYIMGTARLVSESIMCSKQKKVSAYVSHTKSQIKVYNKEKRVRPHIQLQVTLQLTEVGCKQRLSPAYLDQLEKKFERQIEKKIQGTMQVAQKKFHVDLFGIGDTFARSHPNLWKKEKNWGETFSKLNMTYSVKVHIVHVTNNVFIKSS
ncbi:spore gernimation protein [Bacillus thuringiensis]|uniref:Spore germination protein KC n=1 Tax=Bacillus thuringiensis TaxID=1428 RepID=A0A9W3X4B4_BACTU|nr:Ger(x)C family spore germination protein [Bacillus thuringiensis]ANS52215.1 spore germination protein KC [Bacillus thuringiensis]MBH0338412.1 spore gernimation protein [Bacillus thuringiensis]